MIALVPLGAAAWLNLSGAISSGRFSVSVRITQSDSIVSIQRSGS